MSGISCLVNFKENLNKNVPYYNLLVRQINGLDRSVPSSKPWIGEDAAFCADSPCDIVSKICEGYQFTIAFSGEIICKDQIKKELSASGYHFLTDKDAELALLLYIHFGEKCYEKLLGSFSFIIYDAMRRQIFVLCDPDSSIPIFYSKTDSGYILASSLKGILASPGTKKILSGNNLLGLLSAQNRISQTVFEDIYILPPKTFLKISRFGLKTCTYPISSASETASSAKKLSAHGTGIILSGTSADQSILENLSHEQEKEHCRISLYTEKCPDDFKRFPIKVHNLSIDAGTVFYGLESCVSACGFPFVSDWDYLLPIAFRGAKGTDETLFFSEPDRFYKSKTYISTLIKNGAFYHPIENNLSEYTPEASVFPSYTGLIADSYGITAKTAAYCKEAPHRTNYPSMAVKTALRHILLDIIAKEHSPVVAFFKRTSLLKLCEGGFVFSPGESECELTAYLIKLNMWFEMYQPRII